MNTSAVCLVNLRCVTAIAASPTLLPGDYTHDSPKKTSSFLRFSPPFFPTGIWFSQALPSTRGGEQMGPQEEVRGQITATRGDGTRDPMPGKPTPEPLSSHRPPSPLCCAVCLSRGNDAPRTPTESLPAESHLRLRWRPQGQRGPQESGALQAVRPESRGREHAVGPSRCSHTGGSVWPPWELPAVLRQRLTPRTTGVKSKASFKDQT